MATESNNSKNPWEINPNPKVQIKKIANDFFGIFAKEKFVKGEIIFKSWNENCANYTSEEVKKLNPEYRLIFERYSTEIRHDSFIGPLENEDISNQPEYFINHCCDPNAWLINDEDVAARRDIEVGEQITIDYATFIINDFESAQIQKCLCGAAICRGKFSHNDWWSLRNIYKGHFLSWIQEKINKKEEAELIKIPKS